MSALTFTARVRRMSVCTSVHHALCVCVCVHLPKTPAGVQQCMQAMRRQCVVQRSGVRARPRTSACTARTPLRVCAQTCQGHQHVQTCMQAMCKGCGGQRACASVACPHTRTSACHALHVRTQACPGHQQVCKGVCKPCTGSAGHSVPLCARQKPVSERTLPVSSVKSARSAVPNAHAHTWRAPQQPQQLHFSQHAHCCGCSFPW